jgi:hypothetical protein
MGVNWPVVIFLAVLVGLVAGVALLGPPSLFVIRVRQGRIECRGRRSLLAQQQIADFLLRDLAPRAPIAIVGYRIASRLRLRFSGPLSAGEKQRIRNVLFNQR